MAKIEGKHHDTNSVISSYSMPFEISCLCRDTCLHHLKFVTGGERPRYATDDAIGCF